VTGLFELAPTGRSKCRGCSQPIARGDVRFGEKLPNPFAEGEMTLWFHPLCAAYKRPEPFLQVLSETTETVPAIPNRSQLEGSAQVSLAHRRLPRIDGAERAPSGQAKCRSCKEPIAKSTWRIRLVFYEEGMFTAGGSIHVGCARTYFETDDVLDRVLQFSSALSDEERNELRDTDLTKVKPILE
jgi:hypothetical protein